LSLPVAFSLGSNLGDRQATLHAASRKLVVELGGASLSSLWETEPVEVKDRQPAYLNLCLVGKTALPPQVLLELCARLEKEAGRKGGHREARVLDVDLLLLAEQCVEEADLVLPHPGLVRRRFVLVPLSEVMPDWVHPSTGKNVMEMLEELGETQAVKLHKPLKDWWND